MSLIGFLYSTEKAIEYHEKAKVEKRQRQVNEELRESSRIWHQETQERTQKYQDINLELDMKYALRRNRNDQNKQGVFFLSDVIEKMPSYDKTRDKELYDGLKKTMKDTEQIIKRLYLAEHGKLPHLDISGSLYNKLESERGIWFGRERYDYMGQIKHELMIEWESRLHEKGFPYDLYIFNALDFSDLPYYQRPSSVCISQWMLARQTSYRYGNEYFFNFPDKLLHVADCKLCRRCTGTRAMDHPNNPDYTKKTSGLNGNEKNIKSEKADKGGSVFALVVMLGIIFLIGGIVLTACGQVAFSSLSEDGDLLFPLFFLIGLAIFVFFIYETVKAYKNDK